MYSNAINHCLKKKRKILLLCLKIHKTAEKQFCAYMISMLQIYWIHYHMKLNKSSLFVLSIHERRRFCSWTKFPFIFLLFESWVEKIGDLLVKVNKDKSWSNYLVTVALLLSYCKWKLSKLTFTITTLKKKNAESVIECSLLWF